MNAPTTPETEHNDRLAGVALAAASLISIVAMAHHPTGHAHALVSIVHATMIAVVLVTFAAYACLAARRGLHRFTNLLALVAFGAATAANLLAATINGFVVPAVARDAPEDILAFSWAFNQALAYGAVYAISAAFFIWGADLIRERGFARIVGAGGLAAGIAPVALLATGALGMNVAGAFIVYALQSAFGVLAGAYLMRKELDRREESPA